MKRSVAVIALLVSLFAACGGDGGTVAPGTPDGAEPAGPSVSEPVGGGGQSAPPVGGGEYCVAMQEYFQAAGQASTGTEPADIGPAFDRAVAALQRAAALAPEELRGDYALLLPEFLAFADRVVASGYDPDVIAGYEDPTEPAFEAAQEHFNDFNTEACPEIFGG